MSAWWFAPVVLLSGAGLAQLSGCSTTPVGPVDSPSEVQALGFLQQSSVSRPEVEARLGPPTSVYEQGRIVTYGLRQRAGNWEVHGDSSRHLVIVYRADDTVEVWSLVNPVPYR